MSLVTELDEFQKKKAELKNTLQSIEETEKTLVVRMEVLEEKLATYMDHIVKLNGSA